MLIRKEPVLRSALIVLCLLSLCAYAWAADTPSAKQVASSEEARLNALASKPYRPAWAPLPMFQDSTNAIPLLREILADGNAPSRARAAFLIGQIGWRGSAGLLAKALRDPDRTVRTQSGIALACMGDARGVPACAAALNSGPAWVRYYATYGLWRVGGPRARRILADSPGGQGPLVSQAIRGALTSRRVSPPAVRMAKNGSKPTVDDILQQVSDAYVEESDWWFHEGNYEQCIRCLQALVFMDSGDVNSYALIGWMQWNLKRFHEAEQTLRDMVAANPQDPDAYFEQGEYYMRVNDFAHAEEPLRKSVELGGGQMNRRQYAHCLEKLGKIREAFDQWAILLQALPNDPAVRYNYDRVKKILDAGGK